MERASTGGRANWAGAAFELRLGVEFCVDILVGVDAGLAPGAARRVQLQAPEPVDDLILEFETGARWAIQAKAGPSIRVEWNRDRPFGKALRQLYRGATCGQIDLAPDSLDQVVLAVDHRAPGSVTDFGHWVARARHHHTWERFAAACTNQAEREWVRQLPALVAGEPGDELLAFLRRLYVRRRPAADEWRSDLRGRLRAFGVPDNSTADRVLDVLLARVAEVALHAGQLDYDDLRRACAGIPGIPRPGPPSFRLLRHPTEDELYRALHMPAVRLDHFVERPELAEALGSGQGVLVAGRPGSGKSHALIRLALARPEWPVVVVAGHFREDDLGRLVAQLRRVHGPIQLLWDDVHAKPDLFADAVLRLSERVDDVRVLAAYRDQYEGTVRERVTSDLCRRARLPPEPLRLQPFDEDQAAQMAQAVVEALALELDADARDAFARHIRRGDGGPLFALSIGFLLRKRETQAGRVYAADVTGLPDDLLDVWHHLYQRLADRPNGFAMQSLLSVLRFLHQIDCSLHVRLVGLLFARVLGHGRGDMRSAARTLAREGWMRREGEEFAVHDVTLEAVPEEEDSFSDFVQFAHGEVEGEELALGLLRGSLSLHYKRRLPHTRTARERRAAAAEAMELGELAVADFRAIGHTVHLATALNNASVFYSDLAGQEQTREGRVRMLEQAVAAIEEAIAIRRDLGLRADLAPSLNNASGCYSALAELEETREGRGQLLEQAVAAIEEAARLYRDLGLRADLASSLNNASVFYSDLAGQEGTREGRVRMLEQAVAAVEEAARLYRDLGLRAELATSLNNASGCYSALAGQEGAREGRVQLLGQAVAATEEAVAIHRDLGLRANLAASLNNASVFYGDLAGQEETREGRVRLLRQAVAAIEEAARLYRDLGLRAELAMSLNNASGRYSALAGLEETREGRAQLLQQAVAAIEEAIRLYRDLGLRADLATSLNNASNLYSDLAEQEGTREGRVRRLEQAVAAVEEAVAIRRDLGLRADLAMSLNNTSGCYSALAELEETWEGRVRMLQQAVAAIEAAIAIRRDLGLRADLAMSLNNAASAYSGMMGVDEDEELQVEWLHKALQAIQEAVDIFRVQGIIPYLMVGLRNVVILHLGLAGRTGELDRARVLALCQEGEALCGPMEDQERLAFFRQVRQQLQS